MSKKSPVAVIVTGLVIGMIGLLNVVLAVGTIYNAFLNVAIGSIVFGLVMLAAGALWITSGVGYFIPKEWASTLGLYVSPIIVAINLAGVLNFWGFDIKIGWAALSTVAGVGSIWYLSKKELASFFLVSVAEHVGVIVIFAVLIYGEPEGLAETRDKELFLPVDVIEQQEPLLTHLIPREMTAAEKPPTLPKVRIRSITATDPGVDIENSVPRLPRTQAQIVDTDTDDVLRSPNPKEREQPYQSTVPASDVESALESSKKPSLEIGPSERVKEGPEATIARRPEYARDDIYSPDEQLGPSDEIARPSFAGEITGDLAGRRVVSWPKLPSGSTGTEGGSTAIEFSVDPAGYVTQAKAIRKSGNPGLDRIAEEYVRQIRFEELPKRFQQIVQSGKISISFELIRKSG